ncbi:MAG: acyl-CoA dehydrogenase family protein [Deltaproteobacteria bacterium]|nr:acyl-CoA dehydrogenase family protein [Deltaproteobacteria bacterium]
MANFYEDNEDLQFYLETGIDWEPLARLAEYEWRSQDGFSNTAEALDFYRDVLRMVGEFTADAIAPLSAQLDREKPKLVGGEVVYPEARDALFEQITELELYGMCIPRELGGMACPLVLYQMVMEILSRADVSVAAQHGFRSGIAMAALMYSILEDTTEFDEENARISKTRFSEVIDDLLAGRECGCMDITEPHAGSDMAALRCKGEVDEEGNWTLTGQKTFITQGDGKYHFVVARTEAATDPDDPFAGLGGLSMFLVPAWSEDGKGNRVRHVTIDGMEEKLGHHGSATVGLSFENAPAWLIGKRGEGFRNMLLLMNGARIGVGFEALGICEAAYRLAKDYAAERPSMGKTIDKHEMIADYLDQMRTEIQGIRAIGVHASVEEEMAEKLRLKLRFWPPTDEQEQKQLEKQVKRHQRRARHLTPLLKYLAAEKAVELAGRGVQILGGAGYMKDYGAEKLLRDAVVLPIYEGTSQIQALMAMKDNLTGAVRDPARFMRKVAQARWRSVSARNPLERRVARLQGLSYSSLQYLLSRLASRKVRELRHRRVRDWSRVMTGWDPKRDFALALLHAERLTRILADVAVAEELLRQAEAHPERVEVLERWLERAEPRCRYMHDEITTTGSRLLRTLHGQEEADEEQAAK